MRMIDGYNQNHLPNSLYRNYIKRFMDIVLSCCAVIILSPLFLIITILVRLKLGSPVLFRQERIGLNEEVFTIYKFRTMSDKRDTNNQPLPDDERLTKFGKRLRSTSLDELPELFLIIKGDMSIVGPRPLLIRYLPYFLNSERIRSKVRPGITGLAQIRGRNSLSWEERFKADIYYVNKLSLFLDIKIIIKTIFVVLKREDILVGSENIIKDLDIERKELERKDMEISDIEKKDMERKEEIEINPEQENKQ